MKTWRIWSTFSRLKLDFPPSSSTKSPKRCVTCTTSSCTNLLSAPTANLTFVSITKAQSLFQTTTSANFAVFYSFPVQNLLEQAKTTTKESRDIVGLTDTSKSSQVMKEAIRCTTSSRKIRLGSSSSWMYRKIRINNKRTATWTLSNAMAANKICQLSGWKIFLLLIRIRRATK